MSARTPDLGLAAALVTLGYELLSKLENGASDKQKVFCFAMAQKELDTLKAKYERSELLVDAHLNAQSLKIVKRMLYPERGNARRNAETATVF